MASFALADEQQPALATEQQWMIELEGTPAAIVWAEQLKRPAESPLVARQVAAAQSRLQVAANARLQERMLAALAAEIPEARPVFQLQKVLNGVAVLWPASDAEALHSRLAAVYALPGVVRVRPMPPKQRTNATSVPFLGTADLWDPGDLGLTGAGLRLGIIDTGLDYLHTGFGGSGLAADYSVNDTTVLDGFFPSLKVAGGFDFAGDAYDPSSGDPMTSMPQPDPDPMDCEGHGTHVAGTAAGFGVQSDGTTYPGPYSAAVPFSTLRVGPGVAPLATLYALRVFGCAGDSNVVEQALEWALDPDGNGDFSDHLDVVNLSLAARFGAADDPTADAADNAALAGIVVVASAGNDGDVVAIVGSPASADRAIAVAATWDDETSFPTRAVRISQPAPLIGTHQAGGANFGPPVAAPGITAAAGLAEPLNACSPLLSPLAGQIAILRRDDACSFVTQTRHAQDAGAIAVVIVNDRPELVGVFNDGTGGDIVIPPVLIRQRTGDPLIASLEASTAATVNVTSASLADEAALFSSRGPRRGDGALKPDVAAPGVIITSVFLGDDVGGGTGATLKSGTSMSAPHVSGLASLVLERRPDFSPIEVKAALVNTGRDVFLDPEDTPPRLSTSRMGGGRVQAQPAVLTDILAYQADHPERVSLSFGNFEVIGSASAERTVRLEHRGAGAAAFDVSIDVVVPLTGVTASLPTGSTVALSGGDSADLSVRVDIDGQLLRHERAPAQEATLFGLSRQWLSEWSAYLTFTPTSGAVTALRVPLHLTARPASAMAAAGPLEIGNVPAGIADLGLAGIDVQNPGQPPFDQRSLISVLELIATPDPDPLLPPGLDITHIGAATDAASTGLGAATFYIGLATRGPLVTPLEARYEVLIDVDDDGNDDFLLFSSDEGSFTFGSFATDGFITVLRDLTTNLEARQLPLEILTPDSWYSVPFHTDVRLLAVRIADLGLSPGNAALNFTVRVVEGLGGSAIAGQSAREPRIFRVDQAGPFLFDVESPGLDASGGLPAMPVPAPVHFDLNGAAVPVRFDVSALAQRQEPGLLLLHHHNASGQRAETVGLEGDFADLISELIAAPDPVGPNGLVEVSASVINQGAGAATDVRLRLPVPVDSQFEAAASDPSCSLLLGVVECLLGDLSAGGQRTLSLAFRLDGANPGSFVELVAQATTESFEGNVFNNTASTEVLVSGVLLTLEKVVSGSFTEGSVVSYQLELRHLGVLDQPDLPGPELIDVLPEGLRLLSATASFGNLDVDPPSRTVSWSGALDAGSSLAVEINASLEADVGTVIANQAAAFFDAEADGNADGEILSDDPSVAGPTDSTIFVVAPLSIDIPTTNRLGLCLLALCLALAALRMRR